MGYIEVLGVYQYDRYCLSEGSKWWDRSGQWSILFDELFPNDWIRIVVLSLGLKDRHLKIIQKMEMLMEVAVHAKTKEE